MPDPESKFLIFSLSGRLYALDLKRVAEVGDPPRLWPVPLTSPCVAGALNFHGDIVAALHLPLLMGLHSDNKAEKIIVLHKDIASLAFLVDTVVRIISGEEASFAPAPDDAFAVATLSFPNGTAIQLNVDKLASEAERLIHKSPLTTKISADGKNA
jgi:purine-binding chemotaxis protein CheW